MHRKRARRILEDLKKSVSWVLRSEEEGWLSLARSGFVAGTTRVGRGSGKSQHLSSVCRKTFKLKGNKKFRTWTKKSSSVFRVSVFPWFYVYMLWTFYVRFTYPYHGYGTKVLYSHNPNDNDINHNSNTNTSRLCCFRYERVF